MRKLPSILGPGLIVLLSGALLAGCEQKRPRTSARYPLPDPPAVSDCEPGRPGGELRLTIHGNPMDFNPLTGDPTSQEINRMLFAGLVRIDWEQQEIQPALAESWQVSPDGKTWTFKLRRGVRWSDGHPLTADDVLFTWNDVIYAGKGPAYLNEIFSIDGTNFTVTKLDELTVQISTPKVFAPLGEFLASVPVLAKHVLQQPFTDPLSAGLRNNNIPLGKIPCSGPFRPRKLTPDSSLVLERNPEYWAVDKAGQRLPYFEHVIVSITSPDSDKTLFLEGKADAYERVTLNDFEPFEKACAHGNIQLLRAGYSSDKDILWFNQNTNVNPQTGLPLVDPAKLKWFRDQRFRQAVALAIDRDRIAQQLFSGRAEPCYGFVGNENKAWNNPDIPRARFNPAQARDLLVACGLQDRNADEVLEDADGHRVEIALNTNEGNSVRAAIASMVADDLARVGIRVNVQALPFKLIAAKASGTFDYECMLLGIGGGGFDPTSSINALKSDSLGCQWFPLQSSPSTPWEARIDELMDVQMHSADFAARKQAFDEVQRILAEQLPLIYLVTPNAYSAVGKDIGNARPSALTPFRATWNVEELYRK